MIVGSEFHAQQGVIIDPGHCWLIKIGNHVTLAPNVHILAHDASTKIAIGYTKIGRVSIGNNVFVGASTVILPNVKIGDNVVIGAGSIVTHDLPSNGVYYGNPCVKIMDYEQWCQKQKRKMEKTIIYDKSYIIGNITMEKKEQMKSELADSIGFII